jgi:hypothetical protein
MDTVDDWTCASICLTRSFGTKKRGERERKVPTGNKRQNGELSAGLLQSGSRAGRPAFQREHLDVYVFRRGRALEITSTGSKN